MRARVMLAAALLVVLALATLAGCSKKLRPVADLPPETYLFVQGPVDTVNHRVHLYWFGTDPDGQVEGYAMRWVYAPPAPQNPPWDTVACASVIHCEALRSPTVRQRIGVTDSMFTMFTGDSGVISPRFEIFAIDNECASDPKPAVQTFLLSNVAPTVRFTNPLGSAESTYASVTLSWEVNDPDGGGPGLRYRIWLDGNAAAYDSTSEQTFTVPSARFLQNGTYQSGPRTLFVQAVDDGGRSGPPSSMTWYVRAPGTVLDNNQGGLLVVDDVPANRVNNSLFDTFYRSVFTLLPAGTYDVLRPQFNPNMFRSARDLAQTFRQFKAVLWYRGDELTVSPLLSAYQDSIGAYLDGGGNVYLDGLYLVRGLRTPGALGEDFLLRYLGSTGLYNCFASVGGGRVDSTAGWNFHSGSGFRSSVYSESFRALVAPFTIQDSTGGVRGFVVSDTNYVALWAMDGQMTPVNTGFEMPVAVTVPRGSGRIVLVSFPIRFAPPTQASNLLRRMLADFGIGMPRP